MSDLLWGALSVLLATNPPAALNQLAAQTTPGALVAPALGLGTADDPVASELKAVMAADDAAQEEIERWVEETENPADPILAPSRLTLKARIEQRLEPVKRQYQEFLQRHPDYAPGHVAYGSYLNGLGNEAEAIDAWERARELDPKNPAVWNNLANVYAHIGPIAKAFPYYEEAIRLNPFEPIYLHNFGTLVFLFRRDATNYFQVDEQGVFERAFQTYQKAIALDPHNFQLAADVAQTYYGWRLPSTGSPADLQAAELQLGETALRAWTNAWTIAPSPEEREGVRIHFARWNIRLGRLDAARAELNAVTNEAYLALRTRVERSLREREGGAAEPSPATPTLEGITPTAPAP